MYQVKDELPTDHEMRRRDNKDRVRPGRQMHALNPASYNRHQVGPGQRSLETDFRRYLKAEAATEIKKTGKVLGTQLILNLHNARNEAWIEQLSKRPSWLHSQGVRGKRIKEAMKAQEQQERERNA